MTENDRKELAKILSFIAEGLGAEMTKGKHQFYFAALSDLDLEDIKKAANHIARTATFFPKPAEFRKFINGDIETAVIGAWEKVLKAKSRAGQYQSVRFDDPIIHGTIKLMGGWASVCQLENYTDEKWQRQDFDKIYKAIQDQKGGHPEYLLGLAELQADARMPYDKKNIVEIGPIEERMAITHVEKKALPAPEEILSKEELSKRIAELDIGTREVIEDALYCNTEPDTVK